MPTIFAILVTDADGVARVWSCSPRSLEEAIRAAQTCAECNPDKAWAAVSYAPSERHDVAGGAP